ITALLALYTAILGGLTGLLLLWRAGQLGADFFPVRLFLAACAVQWLKMTLVAAMTLLVCSYASTALFASCAGLLMALVAHLRPFVDDASGAGWLRMWPNLALFDAEALLAAGRMPVGMALLNLVSYWGAYVVILAGLTAY